MSNILQQIVQSKKQWITLQKEKLPLSQFKAKLAFSTKNFYEVFSISRMTYILEFKKASPSKGVLRENFDIDQIAAAYKPYADIVSVLTDEKYFQGSFEYLEKVSKLMSQPVLCKDFIIDDYQVMYARLHGANAILLMLSVLDDPTYLHLRQVAHDYGMGVLTEVSNEEEVQRAINLDAEIIGINNRDFTDLSVDIHKTKKLSPLIPKNRVIISESGISHYSQIKDLKKYCHGFLIGSSLMKSHDITHELKKLIFGEVKICGLTNRNDAILSSLCGAVWGGLIFVPDSKRYITISAAEEIINEMNSIKFVGVFKNTPIQEVIKYISKLNLDTIQLHGSEDDEYIKRIKSQFEVKVWKTVKIEKEIPKFNSILVDRWLFDTYDPVLDGGSGKAFYWDILKGVELNHVMIAGGINSENIKELDQYVIAGIDLCSGVEKSPGIKCPDKLNRLFAARKLR